MERKKSKQVVACSSKTWYDKLLELAENEGLKISELARFLVIKGLRKRLSQSFDGTNK